MAEAELTGPTFTNLREYPSRKRGGEKSRFGPVSYTTRPIESTPTTKYINRLRQIIYQRQAGRVTNESIFDGLILRDRLTFLNPLTLAEILMYLEKFPNASDGVPKPESIEYVAFFSMLDEISQNVQPEESKLELIQELVKAEATRYIKFVRESRAMYRQQQLLINRQVIS